MTRPTYRFHGSLKPERRSVLNAQPLAPDSGDGIAVLRLYDPIDSWGEDWGVSAKEFVAALDALPGDTSEIRLHINSPGGEVFEAVTILNALRRHPANVVAVVDGLAASCASFLAAGADQTVMGGNSQLMIHDAWGACIGNAADMRSLADTLDHLSSNIADIYAAKAGGTTQDWRDAMLEETWYGAQQAVDAGLADMVEETTKAPANAFDLSIFKAEKPGPTEVVGESVTTVVSEWQKRRHSMNRRRIGA